MENQKASSYQNEVEEVLRKSEPWSAGSWHQWDPATMGALKTIVVPQIQLKALQEARVDCSGPVWGYVIVVFLITRKIYVVVLCYNHRCAPMKLWERMKVNLEGYGNGKWHKGPRRICKWEWNRIVFAVPVVEMYFLLHRTAMSCSHVACDNLGGPLMIPMHLQKCKASEREKLGAIIMTYIRRVYSEYKQR